MNDVINSWPSGSRDTTEFPVIDISISKQMREHLQAFCSLDGVGWDDYEQQSDIGGLGVTSSRLRTYRKMYERLGLIYRDDDKIRLSRLGERMVNLESSLEAYRDQLLNNLVVSAIDILARYQLRNPIDGPNLPESCDVQPYFCIWKAMRSLDNKINIEEMNRVLLHVVSMSQLDEAIDKIRVARTRLGDYQGASPSELDAALGEQVHPDQPSARIAPWFSSAGWGGLIIETQQRADGYRWLTDASIPTIDAKLSDPPAYFDTNDDSTWLNYYIGTERERGLDADTFTLKVLPTEFTTDFARRYITSLLAKPFVILTGNSGTGKTRIAKRFAKCLEVVDEKEEPNWLLVPVGADWTDNTKVLGFYNPLNKTYEKTGILKFIERANAHPEVPHFLILDEMNLSHVERYFSDFLSHMETDDGNNLITLEGYKDANADGKLPYPQNLFVTGTVNIDETTYMFSPKVLDRANVIEFKPKKEEVLACFTSTEGAPDVAVAAQGVPESFLRLAKDIRAGNDYASKDDLAVITNKFFELYDVLEKCGYEFAFRTVLEVRKYANAAHELDGGDFKLERSIDEQIVQKVLPKIHGNKREIGKLLEELKTKCDGELSSKKIAQMQAKLDSTQYASFI